MKKKLFTAAVVMSSLLLNSMPVFASNTVITNNTAEDSRSADVEVDLEIGSRFEVAIPIKVTLNSSGNGSYTIRVKGDLDPRYNLSVVPTDGDDTLDGIQMTITEQNRVTPDSVLVDVAHAGNKTTFVSSELNMDSYLDTACTLSLHEGETLHPGLWKGTLSYNISLNEITP